MQFMGEPKMRANVYGPGDPSVGLFDITTIVDLKIDFPENDSEYDNEIREFVRDKLKTLFSELWDDDVIVTFEDEKMPV